MATAIVAKVEIKMPRVRILVAHAVLYTVAPFITSEEMGERICSAISAWVVRGLSVSVEMQD